MSKIKRIVKDKRNKIRTMSKRRSNRLNPMDSRSLRRKLRAEAAARVIRTVVEAKEPVTDTNQPVQQELPQQVGLENDKIGHNAPLSVKQKPIKASKASSESLLGDWYSVKCESGNEKVKVIDVWNDFKKYCASQKCSSHGLKKKVFLPYMKTKHVIFEDNHRARFFTDFKWKTEL